MELTWRKRLWKLGDTLFHKMTFAEAATFNVLRLYAGDIPAVPLYENQGFIGLSIKQADWNTIKHDFAMAGIRDVSKIDEALNAVPEIVKAELNQ